MTDQHAHTYVMKTYETRDAENYFSNEVSAFQKLQREGKDPNIIGFHGSFTQNGTFNVLLEFADKGTLEEYFEKTSPPSSGEDVIKFWRGLFKILRALNMIHNVPKGESDGPQFFQGYLALSSIVCFRSTDYLQLPPGREACQHPYQKQ